MELDKRIKEGKRPLTAFDVMESKFIGTDCYFSDKPSDFADLSKCQVGKLMSSDAVSGMFGASKNNSYAVFYFCLPCEWVNEEKSEPKYRPYTKSEFLNKFKCGEPINIRYKDDHINVFIETIASVRIDKFMDDVHIRLYEGIFDLQRLFDEFEWQKSNGDWQPFGVLEND